MITDEQMREELQTAKPDTIVLLHSTARRSETGGDRIIWEHGRRNFELRARGALAIVCPVADESNFSGVCIFTTNLEETRKIMDGDPGVEAGIFTYEIHSTKTFPGGRLP